MQGWIIHRRNSEELRPEAYELNRFLTAAEQNGIELKIIKPEQFDLIVTREDRKSILLDGHSTALPDFVLPRMGAGTGYFALSVIRHLERLGVHCFNASGPIETVKDKLYTQQILAENNLPVPKTMLAKFPLQLGIVAKHIGFPIVVKTLSGSQGKGVYLSRTEKEFANLMQLIESTSPNTNFILQEFIETSFGRDVRVFTIGGRAVAAMERSSGNADFKANFSAGGTVRQIPITAELEWLSSEASRVLGLDIAGVDLLFDHEHFKICEVNSSPGFKGLESCCQVDIPGEIFHYLKIRLGKFDTPSHTPPPAT